LNNPNLCINSIRKTQSCPTAAQPFCNLVLFGSISFHRFEYLKTLLSIEFKEFYLIFLYDLKCFEELPNRVGSTPAPGTKASEKSGAFYF
jgi:hypothetical protein